MSVIKVKKSGILLTIDVDKSDIITSAEFKIENDFSFSTFYRSSFSWFIEQIQGSSIDEALSVCLNDFFLDFAEDKKLSDEKELGSWPVVHPLIFLFHEAVYGRGNLKGGKILKQIKQKDIICFCFGLTQNEIEIDLKNKVPLKSGTLCQSCKDDVAQVITSFEFSHSPFMQSYNVQGKTLTYAQMILFLHQEIEEWRENREFLSSVKIVDFKFNELTLKASGSGLELKDYFEKKFGLNLQILWQN